MNAISILTREMVTEYESLIGRKISAAEYLEFRTRALAEIDAGYSDCSTSVVPIEPTSIVQPLATTQATTQVQSISQSSVANNIKRVNEPKNETNDIQPIIEQKEMVQPVVTRQEKPAPVKPVIQNMAQNPVISDDPFFAMINNMSV